jgi:arylsulfatase A-like enzyme
MAADLTNRGTVVLRVGLLGATGGIVLGLIEAACLRLWEFPLPLLKPHVHADFWFFAPLIASATFGVLGFGVGMVAALLKSRFPAMVVIACFAGVMAVYLARVLRYCPSSRAWFIFLEEVVSPSLVLALAIGGALAFLWLTRTSGSPLGAITGIPVRAWALAVLVVVTSLAAATGLSQLRSDGVTRRVLAGTPSKSPNIVLIISDATRADHFSSYGYSRNTTPNLDEFAKRGVLFENAIASSSWTLPAIASIFTGLLPHQHAAGADIPLESGPRTLAEVLRLHGYETDGLDANPEYGTVPWGLARGFESYIDSTTTLGYSFDALRLGHDFIEPMSEEVFHRSRFSQFTAHQLNKLVYDCLDHHSGHSRFLFVHYNDAHDPYEVPSPYDRHFGRESERAKLLYPAVKYSRAELTAGQRESIIAAYDNALRYVDHEVGELLRSLERSPQWSSTYVIFTSDHGEAFGEHHTYTHGWDLYREVLHVPLIVVGPGVPAGVRISHTARTRQIFSTVLEMAGLNRPVLGRASLSRLWNPGYAPNPPDEPAISELVDATPPPTPNGLISVTTREWQFIYRPGERRSRLYHWRTDPLEQQNLAESSGNQPVVDRLRDTLLEIVESSYSPWRDSRYLDALAQFKLSGAAAAPASGTVGIGGALLPPAPGAAQALFPPNPEKNRRGTKPSDEELLRSLPYGDGR